MLAYHSFRGEDWQRAYSYNREAALKAHSFSAYEAAQNYFETSLEALKKLPRTRDRISKEIDLYFNNISNSGTVSWNGTYQYRM